MFSVPIDSEQTNKQANERTISHTEHALLKAPQYKKVCVLPIRLVKSNVSSVDLSSEKDLRFDEGPSTL